MRGLLALVLLAFAQVAAAREAWLIVNEESHYKLVRTSPSGELAPLLIVGERPTWGESAEFIAVSSRKSASGPFVLDMVDKATRQVTASHVLSGTLLSWLSGPERQIVLTDDAAFYISVRFAKDGKSIEPNELGGAFDFNKLTLATDGVTRIPLPKDCVNPNLVNWNGTPLIYAWEGYGVWRFNTQSDELETLASRNDLSDIVSQEEPVRSGSRSARVLAFSDYVMLPDAGVFRLARHGEMQRILDERLNRTPRPHRGMPVAEAGTIPRVFPAVARGKPAIGVITKEITGEQTLTMFQASRMRALWHVNLPEPAVVDSVRPDRQVSDAVLFVNRSPSGVERATPKGIKPLWQIKGNSLNLTDARIVWVER